MTTGGNKSGVAENRPDFADSHCSEIGVISSNHTNAE
jgi:hypothetical protein